MGITPIDLKELLEVGHQRPKLGVAPGVLHMQGRLCPSVHFVLLQLRTPPNLGLQLLLFAEGTDWGLLAGALHGSVGPRDGGGAGLLGGGLYGRVGPHDGGGAGLLGGGLHGRVGPHDGGGAGLLGGGLHGRVGPHDGGGAGLLGGGLHGRVGPQDGGGAGLLGGGLHGRVRDLLLGALAVSLGTLLQQTSIVSQQQCRTASITVPNTVCNIPEQCRTTCITVPNNVHNSAEPPTSFSNSAEQRD
jgi:hypothetical protein